MSLTMVFTEEDHVVTQFLCQIKATVLGTFPLKNWRSEQTSILKKKMTLTVTLNIVCLPVK